jgi:hypothetical protein
MSPVHLLGHIDPSHEVVIVHRRDHAFAVRPGTKHMCRVCGLARLDPCHGAFSYRAFGSGVNRFVYQKTKRAWEDMFLDLLAATDLPRPCRHIEVMGQICFPDRHDRDEDNHRFPYSKFLGDALQRGGYLLNDDWSSFRFRDLDRVDPEPGQQWTRLLLMPDQEREAA